MNIAIIGGGAAGFFAAINIKEMAPKTRVTIFEASSKSLAKVGVSGGGRCNLTNTFEQIDRLPEAYPRGANLIKQAFKVFDHRATRNWFEDHGVELVAQSDECIFPASQSSQQIIDTFLDLARLHDISIKHSHRLENISPLDKGYRLDFVDAKLRSEVFDAVIITTGGSPKIEGLNMLRELELKLEPTMPSLFSFNIPNDPITELMGTVVEGAMVSLSKSKLSASGALLITHWGMSGPAILRLSSYGARLLGERDYKSIMAVNWVGQKNTDKVMSCLQQTISQHGAKLVSSVRPFGLPSRLWLALLEKAGISHQRRFAELGSKGLNRLVNKLTNDEYAISGQSRFREEFVTCGGVALSNINLSNCQSKGHPNLYFAGEVLDVDAITGGFNLQAAWSTAYVVAKDLAAK